MIFRKRDYRLVRVYEVEFAFSTAKLELWESGGKRRTVWSGALDARHCSRDRYLARLWRVGVPLEQIKPLDRRTRIVFEGAPA